MNYCTSCGSELGLGRFCTNCGAPIAGRDAAPSTPPPAAPRPVREPTVRRPVVAPDAAYGSRYPLYADDAATSVRPAVPAAPPPPPPAAPPVFAPAPPPAPLTTPTAPGGRRGPRRTNTPWVILLILGILAAGITGFWLATRDPGGNGSTADDERRTPSPTDTATADETESTDDETPPTGDPTDLARSSRINAPAPMTAGQDLQGNPVSFAASNMLDSNARTAYRLAGDATGTVIRFELLQEASITEIGLINGYAKTDTTGGRTVDWYAKNRRILTVEWRFDDGTTVVQDLAQQKTLQTVQVPAEVSKAVELRILEVSPPGRGALSKNVTAISDVLILGS